MAWWAKQPQSAQDEAFGDDGDRIGMEEVTIQLNKYLVGVDKIWAQGPLFDICIMEHFYKMIGKPVPWQYWQIRDSRTIADMGDYSAKTGNKDAHNALADAYSQAVGVQQIYRQCGVKKK
jgi:exodeoxyribonuclease VIII